MFKINNKGFMMAEVVIVSTVILTTLINLYAVFTRMYDVYTDRSHYYNVDTVYVLKTVYDNLIKNDKFVSLVNDKIYNVNDPATNDENKMIINYYEFVNYSNTTKCEYLSSVLCSTIKDSFNIKSILIVRYDENTFNNVRIKSDGTNDDDNILHDSGLTLGMLDYFRFLDKSMNYDADYNYMLVVDMVGKDKNSNENYHYYGNYRIR